MKDTFATYHPIINFMFFAAVISFSMFFLHPVLLGISVVAAFTYSIYLNGRKAVKFNLLYLLPGMIVISMINPLFNHEGITILWYFRDNPITLESIVYGIVAGLMFAAVILWFSCYNAVMTSDKFIYLFGRIIPALSLIFSMVLRFVPKFKAQIKIISNAQKCVGRDVSNGSMLERAGHGVKILSIMITWALENSIETADSMRSRGYGLKGRTSFSIFRFDSRDKGLLLIMAAFILFILTGAFLGQNTIQYFPSIKIVEITGFSIAIFFAYALLCFSPIILDLREELKWRHLQSKI
ncbi:energy-coupling factor transporter transmembrane component T [Sinanaerobacter chloroacetimidivorans]|uniref:Energy-coupling factor transporter transmembrane protein EcfT n=1 Tax=Sinanaerobacter chloroacetimidivorans TaxID=2818044 RepID=A0A8J7W2W1_9FIRM|nr:energy-coupling factor transporter transmembrane component T [Sinanaerobacter chloroacetimidivorans]MBR0598275.1 energy-coupling factor transporter transmembrane protein EcfT [Sinanaerobacter chloroacetimidivorans]